MARTDNHVVMENVDIIFRNFAGREGMYNREGDRNFCVVLPPAEADDLDAAGWNIKTLEPRDEGDEPTAYLPVSVKFGRLPPQVVMITSRGRNTLGEDEVELLDWADIEMIDMIVRPYEWTVNGKTGIKAYLKSIYVTIHEDPLELKYGVTDREFGDQPDDWEE